MSIVIGVLQEHVGYLFSDGRLLGPNNTIYTEELDKTFQLNDHLIIGFGGHGHLCQKIILDLKERNLTDPFEAATIIQDRLLENKSSSVAQFILIGKQNDNQLEMDIIGTANNCNIERLTPQKGNALYRCLYPRDIPDVDYFAIAARTTQGNDLTAIAHRTLQIVSQVSLSVNQNCFVRSVHA